MIRFEVGEEYYNEEERSGFVVSSLMKRCWAAQLKVLNDFDAVCSKHGLKWFAFCGTLLGAVRHKGFIPWDDDVDVCMLRGDYNMFLRYAAKEMPGYIIKTFDEIDAEENSFTNALGITRINNTHKADFNPEFLDEHCGFPYMVGIDLYPLDYVPRDPEQYDTAINIYNYIIAVGIKYKMDNWPGFVTPDKAYGQINLDEAYADLYEVTGVKIDKKRDILPQLNDLAVNIASFTKGKDSDKVACMAHMLLGHKGMIFPKDAFSKSCEVPFETGSIYVPKDYDTVLKINYGKRYMMPNMNVPHEYPYYKLQERWVRDYVIENPDIAEYMTDYYIGDVYDEEPGKKILLDKIYGKT
ncbi:MAG: LicD family protein [Lachnospiraceae bacterium]|nr:LicD family protein [Lachnospiraceae bacterium]